MATIFKTIDVGSIAAGDTSSGSWTSDADYTIKKIVAVEKGGSSLANVTATLRIDEFTFTKDVVPLSVYQGYVNQVPELNYKLEKGRTFYYSITNNTSGSVDIYLVLVLEGPAPEWVAAK